MYATAGPFTAVIGAAEAQTNGGRLESGGVDGLGTALGDVEALGVGLDVVPGTTVFWRFNGLATTSTPITTTAMTAAATPAIQKGPPRCSGMAAAT